MGNLLYTKQLHIVATHSAAIGTQLECEDMTGECLIMTLRTQPIEAKTNQMNSTCLHKTAANAYNEIQLKRWHQRLGDLLPEFLRLYRNHKRDTVRKAHK